MKPRSAWLCAFFTTVVGLTVPHAYSQTNSESLFRSTEDARLRSLSGYIPGGGGGGSSVDSAPRPVHGSYDEREKNEKQGGLKKMMKGVMDTIPTNGGGRVKDETYTGISDGRWDSRRLEEIRQYYEEPEEKRSLLDRVNPLSHDDKEEDYNPRDRYRYDTAPEPASAPRRQEQEEEYVEEPKERGPGLFSLPGSMAGKAKGLIPLPGRNKGNDEAVGDDFTGEETAYEEPAMVPPQNPEEAQAMIDAAQTDADLDNLPAPTANQPAKPKYNFDGMDQFAKKVNNDNGEATSTEPAPAPQPAPQRGKFLNLGREPKSDQPYAEDASLHVVTGGADSDFFEFDGESRSDTEPFTVPPGTVVKVVKPGEEWSNIELPNGRTGIILTKALRRARIDELQ